MIKGCIFFFFGVLIISSCNEAKKEKRNNAQNMNELVITAMGDTLENGFWILETGINGISQNGNYEDGFKVKEWIYKSNVDSVCMTWNIFNDKGVKFNIPAHIKPIDNIEQPLLFQGDIEDDDNNTYLALLRYDLKDLNSSIYAYLYQVNEVLESDTVEILRSKEFKKFTFRNIEIFRIKIEVERGKKSYGTISYVFVVNDFLYDLTYKNIQSKTSAIDLEIFNNILYSMECDDVDLFNYNSKKYLKEEDVLFDIENHRRG